jgi:hypothetical protein
VVPQGEGRSFPGSIDLRMGEEGQVPLIFEPWGRARQTSIYTCVNSQMPHGREEVPILSNLS